MARLVSVREDARDIIDLISSRQARIAVIGLGYVGLPLALTAANAGFHVLGFDVEPDRVSQINRGESFIRHIAGEAIKGAVNSGRFLATADFDRLSEPDAILICVPTPLTKHREPNLSFVINTVKAIGKCLRRGQLVVLESTTYPGTTTGVMKPLLEETGLKSGVDFFLAYSPEREDPGNSEFRTIDIPKVVGADGEHALSAAVALYDKLVVRTVQVSSPEAAEAVKITENIFRSVNIALVNELKLIYGRMGIDIWEVIDAAKTKPFGFMPFYPGPGLGGHCIPIDPFYLTWKAREYGTPTHFIELAGEINTAMPRYVVDCLVAAMDRRFKRGVNGARVLLIGVAYKKNVDDLRESPSLHLIELLEQRGAAVSYHDPFIPVIRETREHPSLAGRKSISLTPSTISQFDCVLIATDHDHVDYQSLVEHAKLIVDTRNVCARSGIKSEVVVKA